MQPPVALWGRGAMDLSRDGFSPSAKANDSHISLLRYYDNQLHYKD